jgi:hypothetical protein
MGHTLVTPVPVLTVLHDLRRFVMIPSEDTAQDSDETMETSESAAKM